MATWRKNRNGEWVVFGPASEVLEGGTVTVTKKSGETSSVRIERVSKRFKVNGVDHVYGTPARRDSGTRQSSGGGNRCADCGCPLRGKGTLRYDSSGIPGYCCHSCAQAPRWELSFA
jgi:hypothetical protein